VGDDDVIHKQVLIEAPPEEVFEFLTDAEKLVRWLGVNAHLDPQPGGLLRIDSNGADIIRGAFIEVVPGSRVVVTWGWEDPEHPVKPGSTIVEFMLEPFGSGTRVTLKHRGLKGVSFDHHALAWSHYLCRLGRVATGLDPGPDPWADPAFCRDMPH
jgi:uncharacterized protein YndB with AHSA1/START domain